MVAMWWPDGGDPYNDADTTLVQSDWDHPAVASSMGWQPCKCGGTDGTIDCPSCKRTVSAMLAEAYDFIRDNEETCFHGLDDYLPTKERG